MPNTIKIRTGNTVPSALSFATSEPAWDSANKRFYIKANDGTMAAINHGPIQSSQFTMSTGSLLGRAPLTIGGDPPVSGPIGEILIGDGLLLQGGMLSATGYLRQISGAPVASQFQVSEPAWDSTSKLLYIKAADNTMTLINPPGNRDYGLLTGSLTSTADYGGLS